MAGFGDFGNVVGEWAAATGEEFNQEWHGAAPGEYEFRMWRQARNWKNNELERRANEEAEALRKQLQQDRFDELGRIQRREDDFKRWGDTQSANARAAFDAYRGQNQQLRSLYDTYLSQMDSSLAAAKGQRDLNQIRVEGDRAKRAGRQAQVIGAQGQYLNQLTDAYQSGLTGLGGYFKDDLADTYGRYAGMLSGYSGSDNIDSVRAASQELQQRYAREQARKQQEYIQLRDTSLQRIGQEGQRATQGYQQFGQDLGSRLQNFALPTAGLQDDATGLLSLAQTFGTNYQGLLAAGQPQSQQAYSQQQQAYQDLTNRAYNPERGYAQNRDTELVDAQRGGFLTNLYAPNFAGLQSQYGTLNPLAQQAQQIYQDTYGWNEERLQQFTDPLAQLQSTTQGQLQQQYSGMEQRIPGLTRGLESGLYDQSSLAMKQSRQNDVNQQLRGFEQQMTGMLSNFYNMYSNQVTQAQNEFNTQKAFRLREREQIGAQRQARDVDSRRSRAMQGAEAGRVQQLSRVAGLYNDNNLLSTLTRGN